MNSKTFVLIGNQNCGKTTLFNALTQSNQYVGNWPGVTVDKVVGKITKKDWDIVDLPGLYSLSPYSAEEVVSRNFLLSDDYDVILNDPEVEVVIEVMGGLHPAYEFVKSALEAGIFHQKTILKQCLPRLEVS